MMHRLSLLLLSSLAIGWARGSSSVIDPSLQRVLSTQPTANIFISFHAGTESVLKSFGQRTFGTRADRLTSLTHSLQQNAAATHEKVLQFLEQSDSVQVTSYWINNQMYVRNVDLSCVQKLAQFPEIHEIVEEEFFELDVPLLESVKMEEAVAAEWGVAKIEAPGAWSLVGGNDGTGVRVATVDTGVLMEHQALKDNYVGDYGWFDPYKNTESPNDQNGHGTHCTGTICGQGGIGVAPGAKWMACKGCDTSSCAQHALLSCGQFIVCPTRPNGTDPDCSKAPNVVSNSWAGGQNQLMYHGVIQAWKAAGIIPLFANGNAGPSCGSANSPADHPGVIGVGSTTSLDALSSFSSVGPTKNGTVKPDISAPGSSIRSSFINDGIQGYAVLSGTSMACPHAAGAVALLLAREPTLTFNQVKSYLTQTADQKLTSTGRNCGGINDTTTFPNHAYGFGRINVKKALESVISNGNF